MEFAGDAKKLGNESDSEHDPVTVWRRQQVKAAMLHAWSSYEKYAWGFDELQVSIILSPIICLQCEQSSWISYSNHNKWWNKWVRKLSDEEEVLNSKLQNSILQPQSKQGINEFGGFGATIVDSLDTLYIMGLQKQFQRAREYVMFLLLLRLQLHYRV